MINTLLDIIEDKEVEVAAGVIFGSAAIDSFIVDYDWGYVFFGLIGFMLIWALNAVGDKEQEDAGSPEGRKGTRYWIARMLLSSFIPLLCTNWISEKMGVGNILTAVVLGAIPQFFASEMVKRVKKMISNEKE